jgi:hypothetical protein
MVSICLHVREKFFQKVEQVMGQRIKHRALEVNDYAKLEYSMVELEDMLPLKSVYRTS